MNQTINDLKTRRSIRKFKDEQISDEDLKIILETGTYAPTGRGAQSPKIVVIQDEEKIKELSEWNRSFFPVPVPDDLDPFYGAKTLLIVLADSEFPTYVEDGSSVLAVLVNAAHAVGVGSCWIHRARDEFASEKGKELLKEWGIPETYEGIGHVVLGYPDMEADESILLIYIFSGAETPKISKAFLIVVLALSTKISLVSSKSDPITCSDL